LRNRKSKRSSDNLLDLSTNFVKKFRREVSAIGAIPTLAFESTFETVFRFVANRNAVAAFSPGLTLRLPWVRIFFSPLIPGVAEAGLENATPLRFRVV